MVPLLFIIIILLLLLFFVSCFFLLIFLMLLFLFFPFCFCLILISYIFLIIISKSVVPLKVRIAYCYDILSLASQYYYLDFIFFHWIYISRIGTVCCYPSSTTVLLSAWRNLAQTRSWSFRWLFHLD